jgi:hypothetical protein
MGGFLVRLLLVLADEWHNAGASQRQRQTMF